MEKIKWDERLSVGIEVIDEQHKEWIKHFNEVLSAIESNLGPGQISKTLSFLIDYTQFHFSTEEKFMVQYDYPEIESHKSRHAEIQGTINTLIRDFEEEGATYELSKSLNTLMSNWLINHIIKVDQVFGEFLTNNDINLDKDSNQ